MNSRLIHDVAWAASVNIVEVFANLLRDDEKREAVMEVYDRTKAALEAFCIQEQREAARLCRPSRN